MVIALIVAVFAVLLPKALGRPIQRLIQILQRSLTRGQLIAIVMGAVVVLPCTLIFPMMPFIWIAGKMELLGLLRGYQHSIIPEQITQGCVLT